MTSWSAEVKARALELWQTDGMAAAHAGTGVPKGTITGWVRKSNLDGQSAGVARTQAATEARLAKQTEKRAQLQEMFLDKAIYALGRIDGDITGTQCEKFMLSAAIGIDKFHQAIGEGGDPRVISHPLNRVADARRRGLELLPGGTRRRAG